LAWIYSYGSFGSSQLSDPVPFRQAFLFCFTWSAWSHAIFNFPLVAHRIVQVVLLASLLPHMLAWSHSPDGQLSSKQDNLFLLPPYTHVDWESLIWRSFIFLETHAY